MKSAVVLLSGGLDSTTTLAMTKDWGWEPYALSFRYGQRHTVELECAARVAKALGAAEHRVLVLDPWAFKGSALTGSSEIPKGRSTEEMSRGIPVTYVPARNTIFLSFALGWAEVLGARDIVIGVNALDYSGYPDCRPEYIEAFQALARLATKAGVEGTPTTVHAPLVHMTKAEIIRQGVALGVDYSMTSSCYAPEASLNGAPLACGKCDSCILRAAGFDAAEVPDPTRYAT